MSAPTFSHVPSFSTTRHDPIGGQWVKVEVTVVALATRDWYSRDTVGVRYGDGRELWMSTDDYRRSHGADETAA